MEQLKDYSDVRLLGFCVYCGGKPETRDHVPSRVFLDKPYPQNLPVVGCCGPCNNDFSLHEQYAASIMECVVSGSCDPGQLNRARIAGILEKNPALKNLIGNNMTTIEGRPAFNMDLGRLRIVMLKLARGHLAFEHSQVRYKAPSHYWVGTLDGMTEEDRDRFNSYHVIHLLGEIGSRALQRALVMQVKLLGENGEARAVEMLVQDWVTVQDDQYRYLAIYDSGGACVRMVISEYFACEVAWSESDD